MVSVKEKLANALKFRTELMGIAALWVMLLHIFSELYPEIQIPLVHVIIERGNLGVDIFLLFSGIGLYYSQSKDSNLKGFYLKRVKRVCIPWMILSIPYWVIEAIIHRDSILTLILNLFGVSFWTSGLATVWYVALIIPLYLVYPFVFHIQRKCGACAVFGMIALCIVVNVVLFCTVPAYFGKVDLALARIPAFFLGSIVGQILREEQTEYVGIQWGVIAYSAASCICFLMGMLIRQSSRGLGRMMYFLGGVGVCIFLILIISAIFNKWNLVVCKKAFGAMGKMSLELYLIHVFVRNIVAQSGIGDGRPVGTKTIIMIGVFIVAIVLSYGYCELRKLVKRR